MLLFQEQVSSLLQIIWWYHGDLHLYLSFRGFHLSGTQSPFRPQMVPIPGFPAVWPKISVVPDRASLGWVRSRGFCRSLWQAPRVFPIIDKGGNSFLYSRVFNLCTIDILDQNILCSRSCPMHYKMFSTIPGLYSLDASCTPSNHDNQKYLQILPHVLSWFRSSLAETHWSHSSLVRSWQTMTSGRNLACSLFL